MDYASMTLEELDAEKTRLHHARKELRDEARAVAAEFDRKLREKKDREAVERALAGLSPSARHALVAAASAEATPDGLVSDRA